MKFKIKRILAVMLVFCMMIGMMSDLTMMAYAAESTVVEISEIPSLTVGDTLSEQTLKDAVPSIADTDIYTVSYKIYSGESIVVTKVKEENKNKNHYANYVWYVSRDPEAVVLTLQIIS